MTLDKLTEPYLYGDTEADPVETRTVHARIDMQASTATLQAIAARDPVAEPPTLAELQAIGADVLAIAADARRAPGHRRRCARHPARRSRRTVGGRCG
jgi:hypothetical protein